MELHEFIEKHRYGVNVIKEPTWELLEYFPFERDFYNHITENKFSIIKKSRQMHVTTMFAGYVAWRLIYNEDKDIITYVTTRYDLSKHFIGKVRGILEEYGLTKDDFDVNNKKEIKLKNGNRVLGVSSHIDAFCGLTSKCIIIDEAAFIDKFKDLYTSLMPSIDVGGQIMIASTPNGVNFFHGLYSDAMTGKNNFKVLDLIYYMHPKRGPRWFGEMSKILNNDTRKIQQEILAEFITPIPKFKKNKSNLIQVRLDDDMMRKLGVKLIESDNSVSEYIRKLINKDIL